MKKTIIILTSLFILPSAFAQSGFGTPLPSETTTFVNSNGEDDKSSVAEYEKYPTQLRSSRHLQGVYYKTNIDIPMNPREINDIRAKYSKEDYEVYRGIADTNVDRRLYNARHVALNFCREQGHRSVGVVFYGHGPKLQGVHCYNSSEPRQSIIDRSLAAGCIVKRSQSPQCRKILRRGPFFFSDVKEHSVQARQGEILENNEESVSSESFQ